MELNGIILAEYADSNNAMGYIEQPKQPFFENIGTLVSTAIDSHNLLFEQNSGLAILEPVVRYIDFTTSLITHSGSDTGLWRQCIKRSTNHYCITQYNTTADSLFDFTTTSNFLTNDDQPFVLDVYMGAPPKAAASVDENNVYRTIQWPSDAVSGDNSYRVTISYGVSPYLELSTDGGVTWQKQGNIPCPVDLTSISTGDSVKISLSVLYVNSCLMIWLGNGLNRFTLTLRGKVGYKKGKIKVTGKNGYSVFGFGNIRFKTSGYFISPKHYAPAITNVGIAFYHDGEIPTGGTITSTLNNLYNVTGEFDFKTAMTMPAIGSGADSAYSLSTPFFQVISGNWNTLANAPPNGNWYAIAGIRKYVMRQSWDPQTRLLSRTGELHLDNRHADNRIPTGVQAVRIFTGYSHTGLNQIPRFTGLAQTGSTYNSNQGESINVITLSDPILYQLQEQVLTESVYPAFQCVYSIVRLLCEIGGIVPDLMKNIPNCPLTSGRDSTCAHTRFGPHEPFDQLSPILSAIKECMDVEFATFGTDSYGQLVFSPFNPDSPYSITKVLYEGETDLGENYDSIISHGASPNSPAGGLQRIRSLDQVRNQIVLIGFDQDTGNVFSVNSSDNDSLHDRLAFNYLGFKRPFIKAWTGFSSLTFTQNVLNRIKRWISLPDEKVIADVMGQPELSVWDSNNGGLMVVQIQNEQIIGQDSGIYYLTDIYETMTPPYAYFGTLIGQATFQNGISPGEF